MLGGTDQRERIEPQRRILQRRSSRHVGWPRHHGQVGPALVQHVGRERRVALEKRQMQSGKFRVDALDRMPQFLHEKVRRCRDHQRVNLLLQERVLDLAVISQSDKPTQLPETLVERPLLRSPNGAEVIVLRLDLEQQPAIAALITTLRDTYRQHALHNPQLEWLG